MAAGAGEGVLAGKVAVVTGASRGIGRATARAMAEAGASVVLAARDEAALDAAVHEIEAAGGRAVAAPTDVEDAESVQRMVGLAADRFGRLDIAFNNAAGGGHYPKPLAEVELEEFDSAQRVNLRGIFAAMRFEIPAMLAVGGGAIVNMSSTAGVQGVRGLSGYASSKHGVIGLTRVAALDYAAQNIRVNAVAPGPILTDRLAALTDEQRVPVAAAVPMGRLGNPEEVAATVVWLSSDSASFITGATIPIDGGRLAGA
ncbi:MAG: SDR family NAD(P)-dependent oxidoreductase [Candidatus Dormiibacterota bacterium]